MNKAILRDFPDHFETERLLIRAPQPGDGAALHAAVIESFDELRPWMPWAKEIPTLELEEEVIRQAHVQFVSRSELMMLLFHRATGELVGSSGLHRIDWTVPRFEIGYWIRTSLSGQGLMTEAVNGITAFAFDTLGARRVEIRCNVENKRSAAVARRAGFMLEGILRHDQRHHIDGALRDTMVFAQIRDDEA